uniref:BHLH domain-containing protein n=1 Tax=Ciona savignyi TaxID=51511 RepID=H2Z341_CIOSA
MVKASPSKDISRPGVAAVYRGTNLNVITKCNETNIKSKKNEVKKLKESFNRTLYKQLRQVVPSCREKSVSSLDIVLKAVDYINELHKMLENEANSKLTKPLATNKSFRDVTNMDSNVTD